MRSDARVLVPGAGAAGLSVAAKLSAVCTVHAVCSAASAKAITGRGFSLTGTWGEGTFRFSAAETVPPGGKYDYVIIASGPEDTEAICRRFAPFIRDTETVSLHNGIGSEEIIGRYTDRVIGGMIETGFGWTGDASVRVSGEAGPARFGRFPQGTDSRVEELAGLFVSAGIPAATSTTIQADIWEKTICNSALDPLGALTGVPYGELAAPPSWRIVREIVREAFLVTGAEGIRLQWPAADEYLEYLRDVRLPETARHRSPMLQDRAGGRETGIGFLNGAIVERGRARAVPTPYNDCIASLVRFRESLAVRENSP